MSLAAWRDLIRGTVHIPDGFDLTVPVWEADDDDECNQDAKRRQVLETGVLAAQGLDVLGGLRRGEIDEVLLVEQGRVVARILPP